MQLTVYILSGPSAGHIMLSYNWGCQTTVVRIAKSLQNLGFKVWLDIEQMKGDTLEAIILILSYAPEFYLISLQWLAQLNSLIWF